MQTFSIPPPREPLTVGGPPVARSWWRWFDAIQRFTGGGTELAPGDITLLAQTAGPSRGHDEGKLADLAKLIQLGPLHDDGAVRDLLKRLQILPPQDSGAERDLLKRIVADRTLRSDIDVLALLFGLTDRNRAEWALGQIPGTALGNDAVAGNVGEYVSSSVASTGVALTTATAADVTSITLGAGDWDVAGSVHFTGNVATTVTVLTGGISNTSATQPTGPDALTQEGFAAATLFANTADETLPIAPTRFSLAAAGTIYLVATAAFAVNTCSAYGIIRARRVR